MLGLMLWRVRASMPDRPGALARLAEECGLAEVNILGLQVFPGIDLVTDELVLWAPDTWSADDLRRLVERSGGVHVGARPCTEAALADQPTRYVQAARTMLDEPATFPDVAARLFDADLGAGGDVMELSVGEVQVQIRRQAPFTASEHARGSALAALVTDVLARARHDDVRTSFTRLGQGAPLEYRVEGTAVRAVVEGRTVGAAVLRPAPQDDPASYPVLLDVDPAFRRRGIGSRLLSMIGRVAADHDAAEIALTTRADNQAVLPMVMSAGMRGRIRMAGEQLTVRITVSRTGAAAGAG